MKRFLKFAGTSWWFSPLCALGCALASAAANVAMGSGCKAAWVDWVWMPGVVLAVFFGLWAIGVAVRWAWKRSWKRALATMLALGAATVAGGGAFLGTVLLLLLFVEDNGHFAEGGGIPGNNGPFAEEVAISADGDIAEPGEDCWTGETDGSGGGP